MKILLDEYVTKKAKRLLTEFKVYTVPEMGFGGMKNGKLLMRAAASGFDILLTIDKNMDYQQNIGKHELTIVVLNVTKSGIKYIKELMPEFIANINTYEKGKSYKIEKEG